MAGRKPQPTALKIAKGVAKERLNLNEPKFSQVTGEDSEPPDHLTETAAGEWRRVFPELKKTGVLVKLNRNIFAAYCAAFANWKEVQRGLNKAVENSEAPVDPGLIRIVNQTLETFRRYASEFGLTPSSQSRMIVKDPADAETTDLLIRLMSGGNDQCASENKK